MTKEDRGLLDTLLVGISDVAENYGTILLAGLLIAGGAMAYGYFIGNQVVLIGAIIGAMIFVFGPPAVLMSAYLTTLLIGKFRSKENLTQKPE